MSDGVPELFNRVARRQKQGKRIVPLLLERHEADGVHWGVSITSHDPEPDDYYGCRTKEEALGLVAMIKDDNPL